jgi:hypothetical protein
MSTSIPRLSDFDLVADYCRSAVLVGMGVDDAGVGVDEAVLVPEGVGAVVAVVVGEAAGSGYKASYKSEAASLNARLQSEVSAGLPSSFWAALSRPQASS